MNPAREQLISDWRERLAEAGDVHGASASRAAWLTRLRQRLFHFMLSLYGDGAWNAASPAQLGPAAQADANLPQPDQWSPRFQGLKDEQTLRQTLRAIAAAQRHPPSGPYTQEFNRVMWVTISVSRERLDPYLCQQALDAKGIPTYLVRNAAEVAVAIPAHHRAAALNLLVSNVTRLRRTIVVRATNSALTAPSHEVDRRWHYLLWAATLILVLTAALHVKLLVDRASAANALDFSEVLAAIRWYIFEYRVWLVRCSVVVAFLTLLLFHLRTKRLRTSATRNI